MQIDDLWNDETDDEIDCTPYTPEDACLQGSSAHNQMSLTRYAFDNDAPHTEFGKVRGLGIWQSTSGLGRAA